MPPTASSSDTSRTGISIFAKTVGSNISLVCGLVLTLVSLYPFIYNNDSTLRAPFDLSVYHGAVRHWVETGSIYDWAYPPEYIYGFTYPPFAALFFSPIALFGSVRILSPIFLLANTAATVAATVVSLRALGYRGRTSLGVSLWLAPLLLLTFPISQNMWMGQINMFLLLLILVDTLLLSGTRYSGILTAVAASIKMTPAIFGLYFVAKKDWGALTRFILTGAAGILVSFLVAPKISLEFFTDKIFEANRVGSIIEPLSFNILGETSRLFPAPYNVILYILLAVALALVAYTSTVLLHRDGQELYAVTVMGFFMLMVSPISWNHHWVWVLPALLVCAVGGYRAADQTYLFLAIAGTLIFTQRFEAWFSGNGWEIGQWPLYAVAMHLLPAVWTVLFMSLPLYRQAQSRARTLSAS